MGIGSAHQNRPRKMQLHGLSGAKEKLQRVGFKLDSQRDFRVGKGAWIKGKSVLETGLRWGSRNGHRQVEAETGNSFY